jgi:integrase/recombinase XerD
MLSHYAGLRVGEIAALTVGDIVDQNGEARDELRLKPHQTKGALYRTVFLNKLLQREIHAYLASLSTLPESAAPLPRTQKQTAFSANTLCQLFGELYRKAGIDGATSHSGRRSFITKLAHSGVSAKVIVELAGHKISARCNDT